MKISLYYMLALIAALLLVGCGSGEDSSAETSEKKSQPVLQAKLDAKSSDFQKNAPAEVLAIFSDGVRQVAESGVIESALKEGDIAPDFELPNAEGNMVRLSSVLVNGPVVLTWYRGGWCPYCNIQLAEYGSRLDEFTSAGGQLIALSPEIPDSSLSTKERSALQFEVLSDVGNKTAKEYGVVYTLPESVDAVLGSMLDLSAFNSDDSKELPLAVTYVIDSERKIRYAFVDADYKKRAEPDDIITALKAL